MVFDFPPNVTVTDPVNLYKWAKIWGRVQKRYYPYDVYLRRERQIEDFVALNGFCRVFVEKDTDVLKDLGTSNEISQSDLVVITDQKFSRAPCDGIIERILTILDQCPCLLLCLNRHYINIDNTFHDSVLDPNLNLAITQWLKKNLLSCQVLDLSLDYLDRGDWFTWVIPDRIYYIQKHI
jgi:hypothetical protein